MRLTKGNRYDLTALTFCGWSDGDGSGHEGYTLHDYFDCGIYLGPDEHGIEPIFFGGSRVPLFRNPNAKEQLLTNE